MDRAVIFSQYETHPMLGRVFKRLKPDELVIAKVFLAENIALTKDEFAIAVVRMFIDKPTKPKHWREIEELLICCNSALN